MTGFSKARSARRGANAIEFALTLPLFLTIMLGVMDYGFLFGMQAGLDSAATLSCREGAMVDPALGSPVGTAVAQFNSRSSLFCGGGACNFTATDLNSGPFAVPNRSLECSATRSMAPLTGFVPYPSSISTVSFFRFEWQRQP
jgi:hypothetical protein